MMPGQLRNSPGAIRPTAAIHNAKPISFRSAPGPKERRRRRNHNQRTANIPIRIPRRRANSPGGKPGTGTDSSLQQNPPVRNPQKLRMPPGRRTKGPDISLTGPYQTHLPQAPGRNQGEPSEKPPLELSARQRRDQRPAGCAHPAPPRHRAQPIPRPTERQPERVA